eukprot:s2230_g5.t1
MEEWDSLGVPLDNFSVLIGPVEELASSTTSTQMQATLHVGPSPVGDADTNLMIVAIVLGFAFSMAAVDLLHEIDPEHPKTRCRVSPNKVTLTLQKQARFEMPGGKCSSRLRGFRS